MGYAREYKNSCEFLKKAPPFWTQRHLRLYSRAFIFGVTPSVPQEFR